MLLQLENVQKKYNDFHLNCSLQVEEGNITGIIGANGAGKSTTFKAALGLIRTEGGTIRILGKDSREITTEDKQKIGVVLSENTFNDMLTIQDILPVMETLYTAFQKDKFTEKCRQYDLPLKKQFKDFSTGMKAKFKLLLAMSYDARLLILDEPTAGLDAVVRNDLLDEMRDYMKQDGRAILISSHISSDLEGLCDDLYFIQNGKVLFHEDTDIILSGYSVLKVNDEQYRFLDKSYLLYEIKEAFGYRLLTREKQFYLDNYPGIVAEKGNIDEIILIMTKGKKLAG